jgi:antitoxin (DNA-binding transcriptional repressor) of toxin-antitoxin stability system
MCYIMHMETARVGVRELRQNLSVYLERIALGETLEVTDRGQPVAILAPLPKPVSVLERLRAEGRLTPAKGDLLTLKRPRMAVSRRASRILQRVRADRRL